MRVVIGFLLLPLSCSGAVLDSAAKPHPLAFEARDHQYLSHGPGYALSITSGEAALQLGGRVVRMRLAGANSRASLEPLDRMPGKANYLLGEQTRASFDLYARVRSRGVYPGMDLLFHGNQEHLEYDFEIAPGRNAEQIRIEFEGADDLRLDPNGTLILRAGTLELRQPKPIAWQMRDGRKSAVTAAYEIRADGRVGFRIGAYDRDRALVIDPELVFDHPFGGSASSSAAGVAVDSQGNIYVAGQTNSSDFAAAGGPQSHPGQAAMLASVDGGQTWTPTALGNAGSVRSIASAPGSPATLFAATDLGVSRSADGGATWSTPANAGLSVAPIAISVDAGSPTTVYAASANRGVFVSVNGGASWTLSNNGLLTPNSIPPSPAQLSGLAASPAKAGTVFAIAQSPDFVYRTTDFGQSWSQVALPAAGGSPTGLVFSPSDANTLYLGQLTGGFLVSTDGGDTWTSLPPQTVRSPQGLAIVAGDPAVLLAAGDRSLSRSADGGKTWSPVLPLTFGVVAADPRTAGMAYALDAFGLSRSSDAGQTWTKVPLPYVNLPATLFVSPSDSRVLTGENAQLDAFVTKWSPDGSKILYSTYLGGSGSDSATGLAVDSTGSVYVAGTTTSRDFPVSKNAFQKTLVGNSGGRNAFVTKLTPDGSQIVYSTLLGGGSEVSTRIAVDRTGSAVVVGGTESATFPVTAGASQAAPVASCSIQSPFVLTAGSAFISKIAADGASLIYSTFLGGSCATRAQAVAIDSGGTAWVAGFTDSPDFPVSKDAKQPALAGDIYDGFLASFNSTGTLGYATYVGGPGYDTITGLTFDAKGSLYLTGTSKGLSLPSSAGAFQPKAASTCVIFSIGPGVYQAVGNGFLLKMDPATHTTLALTYLGSTLCLYPTDIAVDAGGATWISGNLSTGGSGPQTIAPLQIGIGNGFVSKLSADFTQLLFSTYFDLVNGIAVDSNGLALVAGTRPANNTTDKTTAFLSRIDPKPPAVSLDAVQNAINPSSPSNSQGIVSGELLRILGKGIGPAQSTPGIINGGVLASSVAGVQVLFDGRPVPLLSVSATEIDLMAPFELDGKSVTTVQVIFNGVRSNPVQVAVTGGVFVSPVPIQILGVYNEDFTPNSASNPARAGSVMTLYASGAGQSVPPSQNGQVNAAPLSAPPAPVQIQVPGSSSTGSISFAAAAPGLVAGIFQINFEAPQQSTQFLTLIMGTARGQFDVAVR